MSDVRWIKFHDIPSDEGTLTSVEPDALPFAVGHVFLMRDIPSGACRGDHAHYYLQEVVIAASGSFVVTTYDERGWRHWNLNNAGSGLYLPPRCWRRLSNFSGNAVALVLASDPYDEADYIRDMGYFRTFLGTPEEGFFEKRAKAKNIEDFARMQK
jgi:hypothetical protein